MSRLPDWKKLRQWAEEEVVRVVDGLHEELRETAESVAVDLADWPSEEILGEEFEPDILGLYVGGAFPDAVEVPDLLPPQIFLFLGSIWDYAEGREKTFRAEVRTTYLHELGHYLGLDEDDMVARGLD